MCVCVEDMSGVDLPDSIAPPSLDTLRSLGDGGYDSVRTIAARIQGELAAGTLAVGGAEPVDDGSWAIRQSQEPDIHSAEYWGLQQ